MEKWTKRLDDMHYYMPNNNPSEISKTLCGKVMLGSDYSKDYPDRKICTKCKHLTMQMKLE